jgi:hypothetical protein
MQRYDGPGGLIGAVEAGALCRQHPGALDGVGQ